MSVIQKLKDIATTQLKNKKTEYVRFLDSGCDDVKRLKGLLETLDKSPDDAASDLKMIQEIRELKAKAYRLEQAEERLAMAEHRHLEVCGKRQQGIAKLNADVAASHNAQETARGELVDCRMAKQKLRDYPADVVRLLG